MVRCAVHSVFLGPLGQESQFSPLFIEGFEPFPITLDVVFITKVN